MQLSIGFMLTKYIAHPTENLPEKDDPDIAFLISSEELTFRLAREIDAYMEALHSGQDISPELDLYKNIITTIMEMNRIDDPQMFDRIKGLERKLEE